MEDEKLNAEAGEQPEIIASDPAETITNRSASFNEETDRAEAEEAAAAEEAKAAEAAAKAEGEGAEAAPKPAEKAKTPLDWKERRRIEEMNKRRAAEAKAAELEAEVERLRAERAAGAQPDAGPPATMTAEQAKAAARAELEAENQARAFRDATGRVLQAGMSSISDFEDARREMVQNFGDHLASRNDFFEALTGLDPDDVPADQVEAHKAQVFYALARDPERTERLLSLPPLKMAMELTKISNGIAKPPRAPKPISKAPAPVSPITGSPQSSGRLDDESMPMDQWAKTYLKEMAGKGR